MRSSTIGVPYLTHAAVSPGTGQHISQDTVGYRENVV